MARRESAILGAAPVLSRGIDVPKPVALDFTRDALHALAWSSEFRDLHPADQREPEVQAALRQRAPRMDRTVLDGCALLDTMPAATLQSVSRQLDSDPRLAARIRDDVLAQAESVGLPAPVQRRFGRVVDRTVWRMTKQNPELMRQRTLRGVDRVGHHLGVDWRTESPGGLWVPSTSGPPPSDDPDRKRPSKPNKTQQVGLVLLGIQFALGAAGLILGVATFSLIGALMGTVAGVILVASAITLIVGAVRGF